MKVIIVGGVAGGATAAARIRRLDEHAQITVYERSGFVSYANCGLPYYVGGVITDKEQLTLQTPGSFQRRFRVDVKVRHEVTALDPAGKTVTVRNLDTGEEFRDSYDKLLLAPGARPALPDVPGLRSNRLFTLRTVENTLRIRAFLAERRPASAVLVGGGYIGLETAENLCRNGVKITVIQRPLQLLNTLDADMASFVHARLRAEGITLLLGREVSGFREDADGIQIQLTGGAALRADMVLLAVGVRPDTALAAAAGLKQGQKGSIVVNDRMQTSAPDVYAVGDAVQIRHAVSGQDALISLAGPANKQGRIAADNICGGNSRYGGSLGSSVIRLFDMTAASTGLTEKAARAAGLDCDRVVLSPASHTSYYPGAKVMTMKVVFERGSLRLLGAQIVGFDGVDKRLDVLATAIAGQIRADRLQELDLAYAPPFSSAKDPVNMAGYMIENLAAGRVKQFHWDELAALPTDGSVTLLDVRTGREYAAGHVEGFLPLPVDELRERLGELDKARPVYVMCQSGLRSYLACRILAQEGFDCYNFSGGYRFYESILRERACSEYASPCGMEK